jgi:hypothetical protein
VRGAVPDHCHERADAGAATHQKEWTAEFNLPDEVSSDWTAQLELVTLRKLVDQVRRNLPVINSLDGERDLVDIFWRGSDRITPLGLIAVLCGEANVNVLACPMTRPIRRGEHERPYAWCFVHASDKPSLPPGQSPL